MISFPYLIGAVYYINIELPRFGKKPKIGGQKLKKKNVYERNIVWGFLNLQRRWFVVICPPLSAIRKVIKTISRDPDSFHYLSGAFPSPILSSLAVISHMIYRSSCHFFYTVVLVYNMYRARVLYVLGQLPRAAAVADPPRLQVTARVRFLRTVKNRWQQETRGSSSRH